MSLPLLLRSALALAASAVYIDHRSRKSEEDHPPTGRFVEVDGVRLHYIEKGRGRPLVMLHGNSSMAADFELSGLVDMAAARYRVIVFDRPGYGYSERPEDRCWTATEQARLFSQAFAAVGAERPLVLGHSGTGPDQRSGRGTGQTLWAAGGTDADHRRARRSAGKHRTPFGALARRGAPHRATYHRRPGSYAAPHPAGCSPRGD